MIVSIIIPSHGAPDFLSKAIESALNQTYRSIEVIVVDDNNVGSIDRTLTEGVAKKFSHDNRFVYHQHERNLNGSAARNTGVYLAKGEFVAFLDSDDEYLPDRVLRCVNSLVQNPNYLGVYSGCEFRKGGKVYNRLLKATNGSFLVETLACRFMFYTGSNLFVKRDVYKSLGGFDVNLKRHQDYDFLVRLFQIGELIGIEEILVVKNNENKNLPSVDEMAFIKKIFLQKHADVLLDLSRRESLYVKRSHMLELSEQSFRSGKYIKGFSFLLRSFMFGIGNPLMYLRLGYYIFFKG